MFKVLSLSWLLIFSVSALEVPALTAPVVDKALIFSNSYEDRLNQYLKDIHNATGAQLQVLTVKSLEDESLEGYTIKVAEEWKLGSAKEDRGLLFFIALNDRKMRIEVGQGLEGIVTDILAGRLIDQAKPYFRQGNYEAGTFYIMENIVKLIKGEIPSKVITKRSREKGMPYWIVLFLLIIFLGRGRRRRSSWVYYSGGGFGGSSGSFSSGGSFGGGWSGGGGGFSGGGSSGSW